MALKTIVKVGRITNLSEARYCAGMGVDMLGFRLIQNSEAYVTPVQFQEMRGWFSGPKIVGEVYGLNSVYQWEEIREQYQPDLLELGIDDLARVKVPGFPMMVRIDTDLTDDQLEILLSFQPDIRFILLSDVTRLALFSSQFQVLIKADDAIVNDLENMPVSGIWMDGTDEEKPGLKSYGIVADTLEQLEAD